jgi:hypothetical protein
MGVVTIEESDDERSIVTPDLRLRFRRCRDRWSHAIEVGPRPWNKFAQSLESSFHAISLAVPTYQELHFQHDNEDVLALALGRSGTYHFSASFRVRYRLTSSPPRNESRFQERSESRVEVDIAARCRSASMEPQATYLTGRPPLDLGLGNPDALERGREEAGCWRLGHIWSADIGPEDQVAIELATAPSSTQVTVVAQPKWDGWLVRLSPESFQPGGTSRFGYAWALTKIREAPMTLSL